MLEMAPEDVKEKRKEALETRKLQEQEKDKQISSVRNPYQLRPRQFAVRLNDTIELSSGDDSEYSTDDEAFGVYTSEWGCYGTCYVCGDSSHSRNSCPNRNRQRR